MRRAYELCIDTVERITKQFDLQELGGEDGGPWLTLTSPMAQGAQVGEVRVLHGGPVHKLVYIGLTVEMIGLDSHMVFAFTSPDSAVPHFTLDSVQAPGGPPGSDAPPMHAYHLDLIPRVDLGVNLAYLDTVYGPLDEAVEAARTGEGKEPAHLNTRQLAIMSPWMLAQRTTAEAFDTVGASVTTFLDHWFTLVDEGLPAAATEPLAGVDLAERDRRNRALVFSPEIDKVWAQVTQLVGAEQSERARLVLADQDLPGQNA